MTPHNKAFLLIVSVVVIAGVAVYLRSLPPLRYLVLDPANFTECKEAMRGRLAETSPAICYFRGRAFIEAPSTSYPSTGPLRLRGEIGCLPKRTGGPQTLECAYGLRDEKGLYYALRNIPEENLIAGKLTPGREVEVSGIFTPSESGPYETAGVIEVSGWQEANTTYISPQTTPRSAIASYPDRPLVLVPSSPVSPRFVVEHRSALNNKVITLRGAVVFSLSKEKACPPDRGACGRPLVVLAENASSSRDKNFDITVFLREDDRAYQQGLYVLLRGVVIGSKKEVYAYREE